MIVLDEVMCLVSYEVILYVKLHKNDAKILTIPAGEALGPGLPVNASLATRTWYGTQRTALDYTVCYFCDLHKKAKYS